MKDGVIIEGKVSILDKVLHVLPMNKLSGAEKMVLLLCKNMQKYEPVVLCGGDKLKDIFEENNVKSYAIKFSNKNILSNINQIKNIVIKEDIKIIHAHDNTASIISYITKSIFNLKVKIVSHIHNCYPWLKEEGINKKLDSFFRPKYDYNIACGKIVYDFYENNAKYFNKNKIDIISNAIDIKEIDNFDLSKSEEAREEFNIPTDKKIIGFIGRLDEQKGIIQFIKEFIKYKEKFIDSKILLVGSGSQENDIRELIRVNNLEDIFIMTGFQEDVYKFYPLIDVFFLPSLYEGLPMVLLESMAFKKAIISMDVGSINEVVKDNTGILITPYKYDEFIKRLMHLKENSNLIKSFGENSYRLINNIFNINHYVSKLEHKYFELNKIG